MATTVTRECIEERARDASTTSLMRTKTFGDVEVHYRPGDNYSNAGELAKASETGKLWADFARLKRTKAFLKTLAGSMGIPIDLIVRVTKTGPNEGRGTWIHPKVAIIFAQWLSTDFEVQVTNWVFELVTTGKVELAAKCAEPPAAAPAAWSLYAASRPIQSRP